jgi:hypothetical protein
VGYRAQRRDDRAVRDARPPRARIRERWSTSRSSTYPEQAGLAPQSVSLKSA